MEMRMFVTVLIQKHAKRGESQRNLGSLRSKLMRPRMVQLLQQRNILCKKKLTYDIPVKEKTESDEDEDQAQSDESGSLSCDTEFKDIEGWDIYRTNIRSSYIQKQVIEQCLYKDGIFLFRVDFIGPSSYLYMVLKTELGVKSSGYWIHGSICLIV